MRKSFQFKQTVVRSIKATVWEVPTIFEQGRWRRIRDTTLVSREHYSPGRKFERGIYAIGRYFQEKGFKITITDTKEWCHEHLYYHRYHLRAER